MITCFYFWWRYDNETGTKYNRKCFLQREKLENYNVLIDGRNFYDQQINDLTKQFDELKKVSTGQGNDYTTVCLLDYVYFKDNYRLIAIDLSKQKTLDADPRAIEQILFQFPRKLLRLYTIYEKSKETVLQFYKETTFRIYKWLITIKQMLSYQIHDYISCKLLLKIRQE